MQLDAIQSSCTKFTLLVPVMLSISPQNGNKNNRNILSIYSVEIKIKITLLFGPLQPAGGQRNIDIGMY